MRIRDWLLFGLFSPLILLALGYAFVFGIEKDCREYDHEYDGYGD